MKPIEALKSARNTYICHQVNRVRLPDFEETRFVRRHIPLTGWVKNAENGEVIAEVQGFESRIRFLLKFMNSLKRIKIRKMENKPHSIKETETEFRIL